MVLPEISPKGTIKDNKVIAQRTHSKHDLFGLLGSETQPQSLGLVYRARYTGKPGGPSERLLGFKKDTGCSLGLFQTQDSGLLLCNFFFSLKIWLFI